MTSEREPVAHQWCRLAGPGRGDCANYVGLPDVLDETTTDVYGIPHGWCDYCWKVHTVEALEAEVARLREALTTLFPAEEGFTEMFDDLVALGLLVEVPSDEAFRQWWGDDEETMWVFYWRSREATDDE